MADPEEETRNDKSKPECDSPLREGDVCRVDQSAQIDHDVFQIGLKMSGGKANACGRRGELTREWSSRLLVATLRRVARGAGRSRKELIERDALRNRGSWKLCSNGDATREPARFSKVASPHVGNSASGGTGLVSWMEVT